MTEFDNLLKEARELSYENLGRKITFYYPGMFTYYGDVGAYPAISITGKSCALKCAHCGGKLLESMIPAETPEKLINACKRVKEKGNFGVLITGGCLADGSLPWKKFINAISYVKENFGLFVSVHTGLIDEDTAKSLASAGIDQALIDVITDYETYRNVYNLDSSIPDITKSLEALKLSNIPIIPHIVVGLNFGKITGEYDAVKIIKDFEPEALVFVSLMPVSGTQMAKVKPPSAEEIAVLMAKARFDLPFIPFSLGCVRERGNHLIDLLAVESGINRIALPCNEAVKKAEDYALEIEWKRTCCSVP